MACGMNCHGTDVVGLFIGGVGVDGEIFGQVEIVIGAGVGGG